MSKQHKNSTLHVKGVQKSRFQYVDLIVDEGSVISVGLLWLEFSFLSPAPTCVSLSMSSALSAQPGDAISFHAPHAIVFIPLSWNDVVSTVFSRRAHLHRLKSVLLVIFSARTCWLPGRRHSELPTERHSDFH